EAGTEGFVWTDADGMLGLGDLPGGGFGSRALDVSADGSVVVGGSSGVHGPDSPFVWTRATGMISLVDLLTDAGIDLSDWILAGAVGVAADGRTTVGNGVRRSTGVPEAWIAIIDPPCPADSDGDHALTPADFTAFRSAF